MLALAAGNRAAGQAYQCSGAQRKQLTKPALKFILSPSISVLSHLWDRVAVDEAGEVGLLVVPRVHAVRLQLDLGRVCQKERK